MVWNEGTNVLETPVFTGHNVEARVRHQRHITMEFPTKTPRSRYLYLLAMTTLSDTRHRIPCKVR